MEKIRDEKQILNFSLALIKVILCVSRLDWVIVETHWPCICCIHDIFWNIGHQFLYITYSVSVGQRFFSSIDAIYI